MILIKNRILLISLFLVMVHLSFAQTKDQINYLDNYYEEAFQAWEIPGMAVAIVDQDGIVFEKGYGFSDLEQKIPVDEHTLFAVASNTKAFTASALAQLVEQGRIEWKDKVRDHLPWFTMKVDFVGREMTIEDLLCHRSGLKTFSGDLLWYGTDKTPMEIVMSAKHLEATLDFRAEYGYSNIMYIAAGLVIESVSDTAYGEYIKHHFIDPLQMERTIISVDQLEDVSNVATPYFLENDNHIPLEWMNWDNVAAAGGLISSVHDMTSWLQMNINRGKSDKATFFSDASFEKMTTPHINFMVNKYTRDNQPSKHFRGYGLGWSLNDHHGFKVISHGGGYDGMISKTCIVPEAGIGIVVLTNSLNYVPSALVEKTLDIILSGSTDGIDYADLYLKSYLYNQNEQAKIKNDFDEKRAIINPNHLPLEKYTGIFRDKMYGDIKVSIIEDNLFFEMLPTAIFSAKLEHWNDHIFTFRFDKNKSSLPPGKLWYEVYKNGTTSKLLIEVDNPDFDFREFEFYRVEE